MIRKNLVKIALIGGALVSCLYLFEWRAQDTIIFQRPELEYVAYVNEVRDEFMHQMAQEHHLICVGESGKLHETVEELGLQFKTNRRATLAEARALQIDVMNKYVLAINQHPQLNPFLNEYPFNNKRITISISFEGPNGRHTEGVGWVFSIPDSAPATENRNKLLYYAYDPFTGNNVDLHRETYDEAMGLAREHPETAHSTTPMEQDFDETFLAFSKNIQKQHGLKCWHIGRTTPGYVGAYFVSRSKASLPEAKQLLLSVANSLLDDINRQLEQHLTESPFPSSHLKLRIRFTKSNPNEVESITLDNNQISYFLEYSLDQVIPPPPIEEPYPVQKNL
jgi:hypothetical protein